MRLMQTNITTNQVKDYAYYLNQSFFFLYGVANGSTVITTPNFTDCQTSITTSINAMR